MPEFKRFEDTVDVEREQEVATLIETYADRLKFAQTASKQLVLEAYRVEKPLTGLELFGQDEAVTARFIEDISEFFFVEEHMHDSSKDGYSGTIFLSRLKKLPEVAVMLDGMGIKYCDIGGLLYGIPLEHVAGYSQKHGNLK